MARKSIASTTPRSKKSATALEQPVPQPVSAAIAEEVNRKVVAVPVVTARKNGANLDEEIRYRAYELYLQRNGTGGDPNSDWLVAEREVRARHATAGR